MNKMIDKPGTHLSSAANRKYVEEMLKVVSFKLKGIDPKCLRLAHKACEDLFKLPEYFKDVPTTKQAKDNLSSLSQKGVRFYKALDALDPMLKDLLTDQDQHEPDPDIESALHEMPRLNWKEFDKLKYSITVVVNYADKLQDYIKIEKMAPNRPQRAFIQTMATVYEASTGRPAQKAVRSNNAKKEGGFKGKFFELIWDCLVAAGERPQSQRALYEDIKMVLKDRKPRTDLYSATDQKQKK